MPDPLIDLAAPVIAVVLILQVVRDILKSRKSPEHGPEHQAVEAFREVRRSLERLNERMRVETSRRELDWKEACQRQRALAHDVRRLIQFHEAGRTCHLKDPREADQIRRAAAKILEET